MVPVTGERVVVAEDLLRTASEMEDSGAPRDVIGLLYESFAQARLIQAGVSVDLMRLCGFDNPQALYGAPKLPR
jgi:hypothetical protein